MAPWARTPPLTGYEPKVTDTSGEFEVFPSFFQGSNVDTIYDLGDNDAESTDAEIDNEHIRNALASPLFFRRAKQKPVRDKLMTQMKKVFFQVHSQF